MGTIGSLLANIQRLHKHNSKWESNITSILPGLRDLCERFGKFVRPRGGEWPQNSGVSHTQKGKSQCLWEWAQDLSSSQQTEITALKEEEHQVPPIAEELSAISSCQNNERQLSLRPCPLVGNPCPVEGHTLKSEWAAQIGLCRF